MKPTTRRKRAFLLTGLIIAALGAGLSPAPVQANSTVGAWAPIRSLPYRPVHSVLLPNGKVMFWPANDDPRVWDPVADTMTTLPKAGYNIFCNGHSVMKDGKILVTGGHNQQNNYGMWTASLYDPVNNTWKHLPDMNDGRWYPTQVVLTYGDVVTISGRNANNTAANPLPQVLQVSNGQWRTLTSASLGMALYPAAFLAPNGKVFVATQTSRYLDTAGTGAWTTVATRQVSGRDSYGSACMYEVGKVIYIGGANPPVASCETINLNAATPAWSLVAPMPQARRQHNATILPDGTVLVTGGSSTGGGNSINDGAKPAINWNPASNTWTTWAMEGIFRGYHSEAVLLPDARVANIGGDGNSSLQVFSPPYLFKGGTRPAISSAPATVGHGQTFFVGSAQATSITKVNWVRLAAVTHTKNMDQRINTLSFSQASGGLNVTAPNDNNHCPPGYYMLFLLNGNGVPSVAKIIRIGNGAGINPGTPADPTSLTAAAASSTRVNLSWNDNSGNESGFKIERQETSGNQPYQRIATVGANVTTYADNGVTSGKTYKYRIRAYNTPGHSKYLVSANVTTP